jgi:hypothetical protein
MSLTTVADSLPVPSPGRPTDCHRPVPTPQGVRSRLAGSLPTDPTRPDRPKRPKRPAVPTRPVPQRGRRAMLDELTEDPRYLEIKEKLGEPLTPGERARLEAWRAASAQSPAPSAQAEGGEP